MKITAGLGSIDDYPRYVRAGADELFCGYVPFSWSEKYGTVLPLNRREVLNYNVQIGSFSELEILANMVQKYQKPVHLAFNSLYYRPEQYEEITQIIQQCRSIGFDSYILADPALLVYLRKEKIDCEVHLSGEFCDDRGFCERIPEEDHFPAQKYDLGNACSDSAYNCAERSRSKRMDLSNGVRGICFE